MFILSGVQEAKIQNPVLTSTAVASGTWSSTSEVARLLLQLSIGTTALEVMLSDSVDHIFISSGCFPELISDVAVSWTRSDDASSGEDLAAVVEYAVCSISSYFTMLGLSSGFLNKRKRTNAPCPDEERKSVSWRDLQHQWESAVFILTKVALYRYSTKGHLVT
jgi:hypothetical protein